MTITSTCGLEAGYEPIPGYRLEALLGTGGFGEVWRAEAPGGLHKAIKFVHGSLDERRAMRELRSLERIKGVHHPFLLTLERFEVIEGRLIIITELADGSLEDVYKRHIQRGSCGIPRTALMGYLNDAADALDYLNEKFQLQHLDVKPGNMLMVGGHVKVGDFGLLKDLREVESSMVGGLTPIYAPPEVFDGRPGSTSDQYSLAVMYQELLTGTRPFTGRTIAQLATQHVHSAPNLEALPAPDRPVVARALEKNPERRFKSCMEFVEALRAAESRGTRRRHQDGVDFGGDTQTRTIVNTPGFAGETIEDLPSLTTSSSFLAGPATGHALVIGLGGTGAECLHLLRSRVASLYPSCTLDLHSVLIDTDPDTIAGARFVETTGRVPPCAALHTPLKTPTEYRDTGTSHWASISRRWVYNVPRSGRTEGLRPLGRLAMIDHAEAIKRLLTEAIGHLSVVSGTTAPRVYLVGSLGGGTGSGMIWDIAHLVRKLLDDNELAHATIIPLLVAPDLQFNPTRPISIADTHAAMGELRHYLLPGNGYPGDESVAWPSVPAARTPLTTTYVVSSNDAQQSPTKPINMIAEYLWLDATIGGGILHAAREVDTAAMNSLESREPMIRSLGIAKIISRRKIELPRLARSMAFRLFRQWLGRPSEAKQIAPAIAEKMEKKIGLDLDSLRSLCWQPMVDSETHRWSTIYDWFRETATSQFQPELIEQTLQQHAFDLQWPEEQLAWHAEQLIGVTRKEITLRIKERRCDLTTALTCLECMIESLAALSEMHQMATPRRLAEANDAAIALRNNSKRLPRQELLGTPHEPGPVMRFAETRMRAAVDQRLATLLPIMVVRLRELVESMTDQAACLAMAVRVLSEEQAASGGAASDPWRQLPQEIQGRSSKIEEAVHQAAIQNALLLSITEDNRLLGSDALTESVCEAAMPILETVIDSDPTAADLTTNRAVAYDSIEQALQVIRPRLLAAGGRQRLVLLVGNDNERKALAEQIAEAHGGTISVVVLPGATPMLIHEAQQIPLSSIMGRLQTSIGSDEKVLNRLQARSDVRFNAPPSEKGSGAFLAPQEK